MGKYTVTARAEVDLTEIALYIADDNVEAAIYLTDRLYHEFELLADNPGAGRERSELSAGLRSFPTGNYIILYRVWAGAVSIVRVVHAARDLDEIFS
jgi:toxin ParE1/3/4